MGTFLPASPARRAHPMPAGGPQGLPGPWDWRRAVSGPADEVLEVRLELLQAVGGDRDAPIDDALQVRRRLGVQHLGRAVAEEEGQGETYRLAPAARSGVLPGHVVEGQ